VTSSQHSIISEWAVRSPRIFFHIDYTLPFSFRLGRWASHAIVAPLNVLLRVVCASIYGYFCVIIACITAVRPPRFVRFYGASTRSAAALRFFPVPST
jgi:hypothetical protein